MDSPAQRDLRGFSIGENLRNHGKIMGKWWFNGILMVILMVILWDVMRFTGEDRVSQQGCESANLSQPTGRRESANRKARVSQPGRRESANQVASQPTRSRVSQPGRESANQVASQPTRSRVSQPGRESANPVAGQTTRSRVRQPGPG